MVLSFGQSVKFEHLESNEAAFGDVLLDSTSLKDTLSSLTSDLSGKLTTPSGDPVENQVIVYDGSSFVYQSIGCMSDVTGKQDALTADGVPISSSVLTTFALASDGDGSGYNTSIVTAGAIERWFEALQGSLLMISPGSQGPGYRVPSISLTSPSALNVPSCSAVSNFVGSKVSTLDQTISTLTQTVAGKIPIPANTGYNGQVLRYDGTAFVFSNEQSLAFYSTTAETNSQVAVYFDNYAGSSTLDLTANSVSIGGTVLQTDASTLTIGFANTVSTTWTIHLPTDCRVVMFDIVSGSYSAVLGIGEAHPSAPLVCTPPSTLSTQDIPGGDELHWSGYGLPADLRVMLVNLTTSQLSVYKTASQSGLTLTPSTWQLASESPFGPFSSIWGGDFSNYAFPLDTHRILCWDTVQGIPTIITRPSDSNPPTPVLFPSGGLTVKAQDGSYMSVKAADVSITGHVSISETLASLAGQTLQLESKAPLDTPTFVGTVTMPSLSNVLIGSSTLQSILDDTLVDSTMSGTLTLPLANSVLLGSETLQSLFDAIDTDVLARAPIVSPTFTTSVAMPSAASVTFNEGVGVVSLQGKLDAISTSVTTLNTAQTTAIALKAPTESPTFTGTVLLPPTNQVLLQQSVSDTVGVSLQSKLDSLSTAITSNSSAVVNNSLTKATSNNPTFTGTVTIPSLNAVTTTATGMTLQSSLDTIASSVTSLSQSQETDLALKANLDSPNFTGTVTLPLASNIILTNGTTLTDTLQSKIDFLWSSIDSAATSIALRAPLSNPQFTGNVNLPASTSVFFAGTSLQSLLDLIDTSGGGGGGSTAGLAPLADPTFSGVVTLPPASSVSLNGVTTLQGEFNTINTSITTLSTDVADKAPKLNPSFTGLVVLPSEEWVAFNTGTPQYVSLKELLDAKSPLASPSFTGTVYLPDPDNVFFQTSSSIAESFTSKMNTLSTTIATVQTTQEAAIALKADALDPTFTGTVNLPAATDVVLSGTSLQSTIDLIYTTLNDANTTQNDAIALQTIYLTITLQEKLAELAPLASPTFTGTVSLPSASDVTFGVTTLQSELDSISTTITTLTSTVANKAPTEHAAFTGSITLPPSTHILIADVGLTISLQAKLDQIVSNITTSHTFQSPYIAGVLTLPDAGNIQILDPSNTTAYPYKSLHTTLEEINTATALKADKDTPTFTGTVTLPSDEFVLFYTGTPNPVSLKTKMDEKSPLASPTFTGSVNMPAASDVTFGATTLQGELDSLSTSITTLNSTVANKAPTEHATFTGSIALPPSTHILIADVGLTISLQAKLDQIVSDLTTSYTFQSPYIAGVLTLPDAGNIQILDPSNTTAYPYKSLHTTLEEINTATDLKADKDTPTFTGTVTLPSASSVILDDVTLQSKLDDINTAVSSKAPTSHASFSGSINLPSLLNIIVNEPFPQSLGSVFTQLENKIYDMFTFHTPIFQGVVSMPHASDVMLQADNYTPEVPTRESLQSKLDTIEQAIAELTGDYPLTTFRTSRGVVQVVFDTPLPDANYTIQLTLEVSTESTASKVNDDYVIYYKDRTTSGFTVLIFEQDLGAAGAPGTGAFCQFDFACHRNGRLLCHRCVRTGGTLLF